MADAKIINYGQQISAGTTAIPDNNATALDIESTDGKDYIVIDTTDGSETMKIGSGSGTSDVCKVSVGANPGTVGEVFRVRQSYTADSLALIENTGAGDALHVSSGTSSGSVKVLKINNGSGEIWSLAADGDLVHTGRAVITVDTSGTPDDLADFDNYGLVIEGSSSTNDETGILLASSGTGNGGSAIVHQDTGGYSKGHLHFYTKQSASAGAPTKVMTLTDSGSVQIPNGTTAAPSLYFAAAADTGFYSPAAGQIAATVDADDAQGGRVLHLEGTEDTPGGHNNVSIGPDALEDLLDLANQASRGSYNVAVGGFALSNVTTGNNNVAVGRGALWNAASTSAGNVGVGLNSLGGPSSAAVRMNNTALGTQSLVGITTGATNVAVGYQAADAVTTTGTGTYIGASTAASAATGVSNETCLGYAAVGQGSNTVMLGDSNVTGLHCYDTSISSPSDSRIKDNVQDSGLGLDFINALRPVKYQKKHASEFPEEIREDRWSERTKTSISDSGEVTEYTIPADEKPADWQPKTEYGLIAQEVKAAMDSHGGADWQGHTVLPSGMESLGYGNLVTVLVKAVQELTARVAELEAGD